MIETILTNQNWEIDNSVRVMDKIKRIQPTILQLFQLQSGFIAPQSVLIQKHVSVFVLNYSKCSNMPNTRQWKMPDEMIWDVRACGMSIHCSWRIYLPELFTSQRNQSASFLPIRNSNLTASIIFTRRLPGVLKPVCKSTGLGIKGAKLRRYSSEALMSHDIWKGLLYVWRKPTDTYNSRCLFPTVKPGSVLVLTALLQILILYWLIYEVIH